MSACTRCGHRLGLLHRGQLCDDCQREDENARRAAYSAQIARGTEALEMLRADGSDLEARETLAAALAAETAQSGGRREDRPLWSSVVALVASDLRGTLATEDPTGERDERVEAFVDAALTVAPHPAEIARLIASSVYELQIRAARRGRVQFATTKLRLEPQEWAELDEPATLLEPATVRGASGGFASTNIRLTDDISMRVGGFGAESAQSRIAWRTSGTGRVTVTDHRIIFVGGARTFETPRSGVLTTELTPGGILQRPRLAIHFDDGRKPVAFEMADGPARLLEALLGPRVGGYEGAMARANALLASLRDEELVDDEASTEGPGPVEGSDPAVPEPSSAPQPRPGVEWSLPPLDLLERGDPAASAGDGIPRPVTLRPMLEDVDVEAAGSPLTFMLGRDDHSAAVAVDLARCPHLLVAGTTGSGKSVMANALVTSILCRATPDEVRMILVDTARVELASYNDVPHLLAPVITQGQQAVPALRWAVLEMEARYRRLAASAARTILMYNDTRLEPSDRLPYILIVIEGLADLMAREGARAEEAIVRLAQRARATGIHMVLTTQRPSADVVTGQIKANIPSRIAFAMTSQVDSRTILDLPGAEELVGGGDLLYLASDMPTPVRLQGVHVLDHEIAAVAQHWRDQVDAPSYDMSVLGFAESPESPEDRMGDEGDRLLLDAVRVIRDYDRASASLLQRRLQIGYARASRLIDQLEARGYLGAFDGSIARVVLHRDDPSSDG